jgi:hypothetical protein
MGTVSVSLPSDGTTADVTDVNTPITTIVNEINGNLDNNNIKSGAAIATSKLATDGGIVKGMLGTDSSYAWTAWTPTWGVISSGSNTLGNGTLVAAYVQIGKTVHFRIALTWGSTTSSTGVDWKFSPPVTPAAAQYSSFNPIGTGYILDFGVVNYSAIVRFFDATAIQPQAMATSGAYGSSAGVSYNLPHTFATADVLVIQGTYEAA